MQNGKKISPEFEDLADQIGDFIEYWGFKKVHGRIWTHMFLSDNPLDAADIIERLGISKALVSMSLSDLLEYEVVQEVGKSDRGTQLYVANPNITHVIVNVLRRREKRILSRVSSACKLLNNLSPDQKPDINEEKAKMLADLIHSAEKGLDGIITFADVNFALFHRFNK